MNSNHKLIEIQALNESKVFLGALISVTPWDFTEALGLNTNVHFAWVCHHTTATHASPIY